MSSGVRVTQEGVDVKRAAEYQEVLDDRWPFIEFEYVGEVSMAETVVNRNTFLPFYTHKLGFLPGYFIIIKTFLPTFLDITSVMAVDDKIGLEINSTGSTTNVNFRAWLAVLKRDITQEYQNKDKQISQGPYVGPQTHGIKIIDNGGSIRSDRKIEYSLHTNAKDLAYHMHGVRTVASNVLTIDHDVGYPPTYFAAKRETVAFGQLTGKRVMYPLGATPVIADSTATRLTMRGAQTAISGDFAFIILKDPVDVAR